MSVPLLIAALVLSGCASSGGYSSGEVSQEQSTQAESGTADMDEQSGVSDSAENSGTVDAAEKSDSSVAEEVSGAGDSDTENSAGNSGTEHNAEEPSDREKAGSSGDAEKIGGADRKENGADGKSSEDETVSDSSISSLDAAVEEKLSSMTLSDKIAQMFILLPSALTGVSTVTAAGESTREAIDAYPVGGLIYMRESIVSEEQTRTMLTNTQEYSMERVGLPMFLTTDEEGGSVRRISGNLSGYPEIPDMSEVGASGDVNEALTYGETMGAYMSALGFNMDFAPCADVLSNPSNTVVRDRSFGSDPELVSAMSCALADGLSEYGVLPVYKHFPGHGATAEDSHNGYAYTTKTLAELMECELVPFQDAVDGGAECIMAGHISLPNVTGDDTPASLSEELLTGLLREGMGFDGIVITDALNMGAITDQYSSGQAAVKAISAGADMILMPADFYSAFSAVTDAVNSGTLTEERIDESLRRILRVKLNM